MRNKDLSSILKIVERTKLFRLYISEYVVVSDIYSSEYKPLKSEMLGPFSNMKVLDTYLDIKKKKWKKMGYHSIHSENTFVRDDYEIKYNIESFKVPLDKIHEYKGNLYLFKSNNPQKIIID